MNLKRTMIQLMMKMISLQLNQIRGCQIWYIEINVGLIKVSLTRFNNSQRMQKLKLYKNKTRLFTLRTNTWSTPVTMIALWKLVLKLISIMVEEQMHSCLLIMAFVSQITCLIHSSLKSNLHIWRNFQYPKCSMKHRT